MSEDEFKRIYAEPILGTLRMSEDEKRLQLRKIYLMRMAMGFGLLFGIYFVVWSILMLNK